MSRDDVVDVTKITEARTSLICSHFHLRAAKRRLKNGLTTSGIVRLYDAVLFGMRYYIITHKRCASFVGNIDLWDATNLFSGLARAGVFDDPQAFNRFSLMVERALWQKSFSFDADATLAEVEMILKKLGVMSPAKSALPKEQ